MKKIDIKLGMKVRVWTQIHGIHEGIVKGVEGRRATIEITRPGNAMEKVAGYSYKPKQFKKGEIITAGIVNIKPM